jgi:hypothetical protein
LEAVENKQVSTVALIVREKSLSRSDIVSANERWITDSFEEGTFFVQSRTSGLNSTVSDRRDVMMHQGRSLEREAPRSSPVEQENPAVEQSARTVQWLSVLG